MEDRFNPFGLIIVVAGIGGAFHQIQTALDKQGKAIYLPSFAPPTEDFPNADVPNSARLPAPPPPTYPAGSDLPPPPIAQGGPAAAAPPAAPPPSAAREGAWTIDRAGLSSLLKAAGGMGDDGCLRTPVIVEGMEGVSRVEAFPTWQPGATLVFSVEPTQGAVQCVEFVLNREVPQW